MRTSRPYVQSLMLEQQGAFRKCKTPRPQGMCSASLGHSRETAGDNVVNQKAQDLIAEGLNPRGMVLRKNRVIGKRQKQRGREVGSGGN